MLRKLFTSFCLGAFVLSLSACSTGHGKEIKYGDEVKKEEHKKKVEENPEDNIGLGQDT